MDILAYLAGQEDLPEPDLTLNDGKGAWQWLNNPVMTVAKAWDDNARFIKVPIDEDAFVVCEVSAKEHGESFGSRHTETQILLLYDVQTGQYDEFRWSAISSGLRGACPQGDWDCRRLAEPVMQSVITALYAAGPCWDIPVQGPLFRNDREPQEIAFDIVRAWKPEDVLKRYFRENVQLMVQEALRGWGLATAADILDAIRDEEASISRIAANIAKKNKDRILAIRQGAAMLLAAAEPIKENPDHPWHQCGAVVNALETVDGVNVRIWYRGSEFKVDRQELITAFREDRCGYMDVDIGMSTLRIMIRDIEEIMYGRKVLYKHAVCGRKEQ